jgi:hypothetical protein
MEGVKAMSKTGRKAESSKDDALGGDDRRPLAGLD